MMTMPTWKTLGKFDWQRSDGICLHLSFDTYMISHEASFLTKLLSLSILSTE